MGEKILDLSKSVSHLCAAYPEISQILSEIGFKDITKPGMLNTAGRFMTIPKGAELKGINLETIKETFRHHGFDVKE